jgi:2-iminobutanoate/2-iminopropanoate deaminase
MTVERQHVRGTWEETRAFSRAVVTRGGRTAYLAGVVDIDEHGGSITGDAEASARAVLDRLRDAVEGVGGTLTDVVTMTVYLTDPRYGEELVRVRHEYFEPGTFPAATMLTCAALARPELRMEIQAIAVLD